MSNIRFTMKDLDGTVMPYTSFVISTSASANAASFTTNLNGQATVSLSAVSTPYYISKQDGTTESVIAYKFFVPDTTYTLDAELLFVDMGKISKDKNDKSIAALIEAKVVAVNAANRALQVVSLLGDVSTIRTNLDSLVQVASNLTNINAVNTNQTNINTVAGNTTNINKVATIDTNVTTVANNISSVIAVGNNINNINDVRAMEADIEAIVDNIAYLSNASAAVTQGVDAQKELFINGTDYTKNTSSLLALTYLPAKTNSVKVFFDGVYQNKNTFTRLGKVITFNEAINVDNVEIHYEVPSQFVGLDDDDNAVLVAAQNAAQASANAAAASFDSFDDRYLGAKSVAPTVDNDGNVLLVGAKYFNSTENKMYVRNSSNAWQLDTADSSTVTYDGGTVQDVLDAVTGPNGAASIGYMPAGGLSSINVQTALVELDSEKQNKLVSGTNIKTINGSSILGSGNIAISGGASDASSVTFAPVGNIASTSVQAAIAELDSEKQITLVSGTNIKTINGTSLLGAGNINVSGGSVVSKIKIAVIGDSGTAQSAFTQEAWPSFLEKNLIAGGMDVEVYNFAIVGERYFTANGAQYESGATQLQKAVAINPDIIIVALGINDALSDRSLVDAKADALTAYNTLRTGAPAAKIIYASQIHWDITHNPLATSLLNREVVPFLFQLRTSGFLSGSYCSSILTDAASTTGHAIIAKWKELDTYIKLFTPIDESFNLDGYKVARLGLLGEDFVHPSQDGSKFLAGQVLKAFLNLSSLSTLTASLRTPIYPNWDDPDTMFALFCESNGSEWVTKASTIASQHISSITSLTRAYRPNNWYMPTRGSMYIGNSNIGSTLPAVAMVEGVKPNTLLEASVNGGAWAATSYRTSSHGTAITVDVASNLFIGTNDYYYRIFNEVYGPYTITTSSPASLTKSDVGLGNVDNTSDVNKPVSTATQTALNSKQSTLVSGTNIKTINGSSILGSGNISVSGGSSGYYVFGSNSSSAYNAPGAERIITGWSLLTSSGSSVTTDGMTFTVPAGAWIVSCSLGITLPPGVGIFSKFRTDGNQSSLTQITGSSTINATGTTSYAASTGSGVVVTSTSTSMIYVAVASGVFNLNSDNYAHRITFMKI